MKSNDEAARAGADADVIDAGHADDAVACAASRAAARSPRRNPPRRRSRAAASPPARAATPCPPSIKPQLATLVDKVPGDEGWVYELKYDGVRLLCRCDGDDVRCISRNGIDWTHKVPPIVDALATLKLSGAWVDGELIVTDPNGRSDFSLLQHLLEQGRLEELQFCAFDLLYWNGEDLRDLPLVAAQGQARCRVRQTTCQGTHAARRPDPQRQRALLARVCNQHLEGLIAKKIDSPYVGARSPNWLKIKCHREQEFVVGGAAFLPGRGTGTFSSLLVGVKSGKGLRYVRPGRRRLQRRGARRMACARATARAEAQSLRPHRRQALRRDLALDEAEAGDPGGVPGLDPGRHPAPAALSRHAPGPRSENRGARRAGAY